MKYGITLLGNRVSPRYTYADSILIVSQRKNEITTKKRVHIAIHNLDELCEMLLQNRVDILICGGITDDSKEFLRVKNISVIDNVIGTTDSVILSLESGKLQHNSGLALTGTEPANVTTKNPKNKENSEFQAISENIDESNDESFDCLRCINKICLEGKACDKSLNNQVAPTREMLHMLDAAIDIACEKERTLCRLSELIYFCLEMQYKRLGVAYCVDLEEPTEVLVKVLRRFFKVYPVCCQVGGITQTSNENSKSHSNKKSNKKDISCNPWGQAQVLNRLETDFNIMVGLCMGADCVFIQGSSAPVTGLFIKDKSLANNPIGAIYSEFYLKEAAQVHS